MPKMGWHEKTLILHVDCTACVRMKWKAYEVHTENSLRTMFRFAFTFDSGEQFKYLIYENMRVKNPKRFLHDIWKTFWLFLKPHHAQSVFPFFRLQILSIGYSNCLPLSEVMQIFPSSEDSCQWPPHMLFISFWHVPCKIHAKYSFSHAAPFATLFENNFSKRIISPAMLNVSWVWSNISLFSENVFLSVSTQIGSAGHGQQRLF